MRKITIGQFFVLAFAVLSALAFITGIQGWHSGGGVVRYRGWDRSLPLVAAGFCFVWFVGLRRRRLWAWYIGSALLLLAMIQIFFVQGLLTFVEDSDALFRWWALVSQMLFAVIVLFIFTKWWLPKRREFSSPSGA